MDDDGTSFAAPGWMKQGQWTSVVMTLPIHLLLLFLLVPPFLLAIYLSLTNWSPLLGSWWDARLTWWTNYLQVLQDPRFYWALLRTMVIMVVAVGLELILGGMLAVTFSRPFPGRKGFVSLIIYPMMLPWVVVGLTFYLLFLEKGFINGLLQTVLGSGAGLSWFYYPSTAFLIIIASDVWQWTPFMFLVLYSSLTSLPSSPIEAARLSGASEWRIFWDIKVPQLRNIILIAVVIRSLEAFKIFDKIYIMTRGGPGNATESISMYLYELGFVHSRLAYVSAMALLILAGLVGVSRFAVRPLTQ